MRKFFVVLLAALAVVGLVGCKKTDKSEPTEMLDGKVVLITDKGDITDKSFNEGSYNGVKQFAEAHNLEYGYLKPAEADTDNYVAAIEQAIEDGATIIVAPGFLFEEAIALTQVDYPDVNFIILDAQPVLEEDDTITSNTHAVFYAEEQAGFLAGYAAVLEGYRSLGFMGGMAVPAVQRFGHGFVQGAAVAAEKLELEEGAISIDYLYTGDFVPSPDVQAAAAAMFEGGVEVIFACGGGVGISVMAAAEDQEKVVIGVDVDQSSESETIITSAVKGLAESVVQALEAIYINEDWDANYGGKALTLDATNEGIGLPMENSKFDTFTQADYDEIYAKLVDGTVKVSSVIGEFGDDGTAAKQFETKEVKVSVIPFG